MRTSKHIFWTAVAVALVVLAVGVASASAEEVHIFSSSFGEEGVGAGQFKQPAGVAVSDVTGDVYVADRGNDRIQEFTAAHVLIREFDGAAAATGALGAPSQIAVDNSDDPADQSENDVYVTGEVVVGGETKYVVYKFSATGAYEGQITTGKGGAPFGVLFGVAVDPSGGLWVYQASKEIDRYTSASVNKFTASCEDPRGTKEGFAVDSEDDLYVNTHNGTFAKLSSTCAPLIETIGPVEYSFGAAVDFESGDVYVAHEQNAGLYTSAGVPVDEEFGSEYFAEASGIAVNSASPEKLVYVDDQKADAVRVFREVLRPTVTPGAPTEVGPLEATLNGSVNPEGLPVSSCVFEYGTSTAYGQSVPCEPAPGAGKSAVAVSAKPAGIQPDTTYHYRLVASNENASNVGEDETFTTPGPGLHGASVSDVSGDSATFQATIDPHGAATSVYFQYGTSTAYGMNMPAPPGSPLGAGEGDVEAPAERVLGLSPSTLYHYRVVVSDGEEFFGPDQTFTTQGAAGEILPDDRAYELVSPANKHGGVISKIGREGIVRAAGDGSAITYLANAPTESEPEGNSASVQVLSTRIPAGWSSEDIASPHESATGDAPSLGPEYRFFSNDLSAAIVQPFGLFDPRVSSEASEQTPYLRALGGCAEGCFKPLVTAKTGYADVAPGTSFGEEQLCEEEKNDLAPAPVVICGPVAQGATSDLSRVVLRSPAPLLAGAGHKQLYEWAGGKLALVSLLPQTKEQEEKGEELPAPSGPESGEEPVLASNFNGASNGDLSARHAISADGGRVFWSSGGTLYMRDMTREKSIEIDAAEAACLATHECESGGGNFQIASTDGSKVYFRDEHRLTSDAGAAPGKPDLYECAIVESQGRLTCSLSDLTPAAGGESADVLGNVLGASEDGSRLYFVADGRLAGGGVAHGTCINPTSGETPPAGSECNLYVLDEGEPIRVAATLSGGDFHDWSEDPQEQPTKVSPDGLWLAFMSERSITGYANRDAVSGHPDAEAYLYDATSERVICASCNPTGARPVGVEYHQLASGTSEVLPTLFGEWAANGWVAALLPPTTAFSVAQADYQSRYLLDNGRLFFNSSDALVPQDVNSTGDVYEFEPAGVGGCGSSGTGLVTVAGGCVGLISSGTGAESSAFLDASETGSDVFFLTSSKLTSQDLDTRNDVYDAHECSPGSPCLAPGEQPPPCTTESSCKDSPTPQPSIYGAPASATFSGAGNLTPPAAVKAKAKPETRAQKLTKALAVCHREKKKARRKACEASARKKFGAVKKAKKGKK
jgi:hypothetical protein